MTHMFYFLVNKVLSGGGLWCSVLLLSWDFLFIFHLGSEVCSLEFNTTSFWDNDSIMNLHSLGSTEHNKIIFYTSLMHDNDTGWYASKLSCWVISLLFFLDHCPMIKSIPFSSYHFGTFWKRLVPWFSQASSWIR